MTMPTEAVMPAPRSEAEVEVVFDTNIVRSWLLMPNHAMNNMTVPEFKALCRAALSATPSSGNTSGSERAQPSPRAVAEKCAGLVRVNAESTVRNSAVIEVILAYAATLPATSSGSEHSARAVAWIEHHKGGDNLVWDAPGMSSSSIKPPTPLYAAALPAAPKDAPKDHGETK